MPGFRRAAFRRLQRIGGRLGITMVPSWRVTRHPQAEYLKRLFREWKITSVIDVGANEGQYRDFIRDEVEFHGPIVSVEPIPALAAQITERSASDRMWKVEGVALGAEPGSATFLVTAGSQFSSFREPLEESRKGFSGQAIVRESLGVQVDTLDALMDRHAALLGNRVYLKLDTQGFDLEVLKGLRRNAGLVVAMQSEASVRPIYKDAPSYIDTIHTIEGRGYTLSQIFPNNEGHFPLLIEFDCHFVCLP